ncbi:oplophorus-luciferin 2-monooxygenase non-catalytic subunit-like isoform X1 [Centruroides sculpturatus]|uniref:oplophorus-luciferin 2-monooxygenase non-catalytic subunit-like isoform X1 n=1 Tax=Centruroides sculpturatus TaxID=218467 RepID=UPI000C6D6F6E|nr:oplophorus-luciferin 2-monooxygenase non-catalytic subunit-like isoform X1 [Centruroides sculpturatus]
MGKYFVLILIFSVVSCQECPSREITPCTCDREGINCRKIKNYSELDSAFEKISPFEVRNVWIQGTSIRKLASDVFRKVEAQNFYLDMNFIREIESGAFNYSMEIVDTISLYSNQIESFPFEDIGKFSRLRILNLGQNRLRYLPKGCFSNNKSLKKIILIENNIINIGQEAFLNMPSLQLLDLSGNEIKSLNDRSMASEENHPRLEIDLSFNEISSISPTAFQGLKPHIVNLDHNELSTLEEKVFLPLFKGLSDERSSFISFRKNSFSCSGCSYLWLVKLKDILSLMMQNFRCQDGRSLSDLNRINIDC